MDTEKIGWLAKKARRIGSTDARAIFGFGYDGESIFTVYERLIGGKRRELDAESLKLARDGTTMEPAIVEMFQQRHPEFAVTKNKGFDLRVPDKYPYLCCTLDATATSVETGENQVLEIKYEINGDWKAYENDGVPMKHYLQVQHQLICTGWQFGWLASLMRGRYTERMIPRDEAAIEQMLAAYADLIDCVERRVPPNGTGAERYESEVQEQRVRDARYLGKDASAAAIEVIEAQKRIKDLENRMKHLKGVVAEAAGGCEFVVLGDQRVVRLGKSGLEERTSLPKGVRVVR